MTFEEYLEAGIKQLEDIKAASADHVLQCNELCTHCAMYLLIDPSIATINAALNSGEVGMCDDETCVNNIAYSIVKSVFTELENKTNKEENA